MRPTIPTNIPKLLKLLRSGELDISIYFAILEENFKEREPTVAAFLQEDDRFTRLKWETDILQKKYPNNDKRPPLFGLPIGVKDIFHVKGFSTKAGSALPEDRLFGHEAKCITILKNAGALIFGKTVTTEFAYFTPGPTRNPHNPNHTPGGSSSGSAAAVSSNLVPLSFGTQTIGSIIRPASYCGVVGYKPTFGRISAQGVIPLSPTFDTIGIFVNDISSAKYIARFLCDNWQSSRKSNYKPKLGIPVGPYLDRVNSEMITHFDQICCKLENAGYRVEKISAMEDFQEIYEHHNTIVAVEAAIIHQTWFLEFGDRYHPKTIELIKKGQLIEPTVYQHALLSPGKLRDDLQSLQISHNIDLWLSPSAQGVAPLGLSNTGDPVMNLPWTHCGYPTLNIPAGENENGLPMGLQVTAAWNRDEDLLDWALEIEAIIQ
jgi:Asp-tRNA(Asn)/Glu-tRNA(Gln) amidotransferase A subunit family amidase